MQQVKLITQNRINEAITKQVEEAQNNIYRRSINYPLLNKEQQQKRAHDAGCLYLLFNFFTIFTITSYKHFP
jgi:hypothetical protein